MTVAISTPSTFHRPSPDDLAIGDSKRSHIHALSEETVRRTLAYLNALELRQAAQVCVRWRKLSTILTVERDRRCRAPLLPWNVVKQVFALLDPANLAAAARVCVFWKATALCFYSAQLGRRHVHDIPAEIIKKSFALLDFDELRNAAQVCVRWRDLGIEHPGFWQDIDIRSATTGSIDMLSARFGQSKGRPCHVTVDIKAMHPNIESRLLGLLSCITDSVRTFRIRLDSFYLIDIWRLLNHAYPELVTFELKLYSPERLMPLTPLNFEIFDSLPGKLREVCLVDVLLPMEPIFAFANVRVLSLIHPYATFAPFPSYLLEWCPNLYQLTVWSGVLTPGANWSAKALAALTHVHILDVHLQPSSVAALIAEMPQRDEIPQFSVTAPEDEDATYDFLSGLHSPFDFVLQSAPDVHSMFKLFVQDVTSGYMRIFVEYTENYPRIRGSNPASNALFDNPHFPEQLRQLRLCASLWELMAPYLSLYTGVPILSLELDSSSQSTPVSLPRYRLVFHAIHTLVLAAGEDDCVSITSQEILDFVDQTILAPRDCNLELHCMLIRGPTAPVMRRFKSVTIYRRFGPPRELVRKGASR